MAATYLPPPAGRRHIISALLAASLVAAGGCAQIPELGPAPTLKPVGQLASTKSFSAPVAAWPGDCWWQTYRDPQLEELIDEALRDSPDLERAQARLRLAGAAVQGAGAALMPEVTGSAFLTQEKQSYNYLMPRAAVPHGWNDYGRATVNLSWEIDFWGKNRSALAAATSEKRAAEAEVAQVRLILSTSVASAYAELLGLYALRDTTGAALTLRNKTLELIRKRHRFGLENLATVRQAEARQAQAEAELFIIDERLDLQRNAIAALLGAGPDRGQTITRPTATLAAAEGLPPNLALEFLGRRPDIVAARLRAEAAARRIDQQKAGFYPSINLIALIGVHSLGIDNLGRSGSDIGSLGPAISLPIFNTERLQGQLRGAHAEYDGAVAGYNGTLANALREVADAVTSRKALDRELASARAVVQAAAEAHRIVSQRYQGELATYLDVLAAEDTLISARASLAQLQTRGLVIDVALTRALGGGFTSPTPSSESIASAN